MDPGCGRSFPKGADFGDETLSSSREITVVKKQCAGWAAGSGGGGGWNGLGRFRWFPDPQLPAVSGVDIIKAKIYGVSDLLWGGRR